MGRSGQGQRLPKHRQVPDVVAQQQDQPRIERQAFIIAQAPVRLDQRLIEIVTRAVVTQVASPGFVEVGVQSQARHVQIPFDAR
jgi:hypothetical protein